MLQHDIGSDMRTGRYGLVCLFGVLFLLLGGIETAMGQNASVRSPKRKGVSYPLSERRPAIIKPTNWLSKPKKKDLSADEGVKVVNRPCRIQRHKSGWIRITLGGHGGKSRDVLWGLPNNWLDEMESIARKGRKMEWTLFRISGVMHVYRGRRYLMITRGVVAKSVSREKTTSPAAVRSPGVSASATATATVVSPKAATATAPASKTAASGGGSSASDMMAAMLRESRAKPIFVRPKPLSEGKAKSIAPVTRKVINPMRSRMVVDRLVLIDPEGIGRWKVASFKSDNTLQEPPVRLLPCQLLERVEEFQPSQRLRVTGIIHVYKGRRFMLLRKAVKERDLGRF